MTPREVADLRHRLQAAATAAVELSRHAEDLFSLAWEKHVGDFEHVNGGAEHPGVETVGDQRARMLWARLVATAADLDTLVPLERAIANYFTAGPSPEGSSHPLVSKGDWVRQFKARDKRLARGDYTPTRIEQQPGYGGVGR